MIISAGMIGVVSADPGMMASGMVTEHKSGAGAYADYTKEGFDAAKDMKRVYFFAASWCPTCMATDKALKMTGAAIPAGVAVFKADFDFSVDLKAKYGITHMDAFVQVDKNGEKIAFWQGGGVDGIAKNLK